MAQSIISVKACIGIVGVCIVSLTGDDSDAVYNHIVYLGPEQWLNMLPEHSRPTTGVYIIHLQALPQAKGLQYVIRSIEIVPA